MLRAILIFTAILFAGCETTQKSYPNAYQTPDAFLSALKESANRSMNEYYARLESATDCEKLPGVCRVFIARGEAAKEMALFYHSMSKQFGRSGAAAAQEMISGAFSEQYYALERATVHSGTGDLAVMRIGEDIYRLRFISGGWRIVQAPSFKIDPEVTAKAMEVLAARVESVRKGIASGQYGSVGAVLKAMEQAFTPAG
jgi:hypothetical protein